MKVRITATGTRPLFMHNVQLASPSNEYAKQLKKLSSKRQKTDADRFEMARIEFEASLYFDAEVGPYIPGPNMFASLHQGATVTRGGKKIERGITVDQWVIPLLYKGPRDVESLWGNGESEFVDLRPVGVNGKKVDRCRPVFRDWVFEVDCTVDPKIMEFDEFRAVAANAGELVGIGDYRKVYGRYDAKVERL